MPTVETLFLLVLSILAMESAGSIRSLYKHFLSGITKKSLNAFYYACSYAKADYSRFMNATAGMPLKLIPEKLQTQPVSIIDEYENLGIIGNARPGSVIYGPRRSGRGKGDGLHCMEKGFLSRMVLRCLMKKPGTIIWPCAVPWLTFLGKGRPGVCYIR